MKTITKINLSENIKIGPDDDNTSAHQFEADDAASTSVAVDGGLVLITRTVKGKLYTKGVPMHQVRMIECREEDPESPALRSAPEKTAPAKEPFIENKATKR